MTLIDTEPLREMGKELIIDDKHDIGLFSYEGHPSPLHHWMWGIGLYLLADIIDVLYNSGGLFQEPDEFQRITSDDLNNYCPS